MKSLRSKARQDLMAALKEVRKKTGVTQQALAKRLRRPQSFVSQYETGERKLEVVEFLEIVETLKADPCAILRKVMKS